MIPIMDIVFTGEQVLAFIAGLAALIVALGVIWKFIINSKDKVDERFKNIIDESLKEYNAKRDQTLDYKLNCMKDLLIAETEKINKKLTDYSEFDSREKEELKNTVVIVRDGLIEAYKKDFRDIYYRLRLTGIIEDSEKAYLDKLFPKYEALGGNSDVHAKYTEICEIYKERTREKYDEMYHEEQKKRKYKKSQKQKDKEAANKEAKEEAKEQLEKDKTVIED